MTTSSSRPVTNGSLAGDPFAPTRIVVMGAGGVGKSALTLQFVQNIFVQTYDPTIEETYTKSLVLDGQQCQVEILDTAGTEQFMALKELYMKSGHGFLLVFSLAQIASVNELSPLRDQIVRIKSGRVSILPPLARALSPADSSSQRQVPLVIVGNKADLRAERQVPREVGMGLSKAWGSVPYYETSARKRVNVDEVFHDVLRQCRTLAAAEGLARVREERSNKKSKKKKSNCVVM